MAKSRVKRAESKAKKAKKIAKVSKKIRAKSKAKKVSKVMRKAPKAKRIAKTRVAKIKATRASQVTRAAPMQISNRPNLLVTFDPNKEASAKLEIEQLLSEINEKSRFFDSDVNGLFKIAVNNPKAVVRKLVERCKSNPDKFSRTFHWIPVDNWCKSKISEMQNLVKQVANGIDSGEKWKMDLGKRNFEEHERDLIIKLTDVIDKPNVDLKDPDKIIKVDILGNEAGISLLRKDEILSVPKLKTS